MRILFFAPAGEYGGAHSLLRLLEHARHRFEPIVVCPGSTTLTKELERMGIEHHHFVFNRYSLARRPDWHIRMIWKLFRLIRKRQIDTVVVNHTGNFSLIVLAAWLARVPVARFMRHSLAQLRGGHSRTDRWFLQRCDALIYITKFVEAESQRELARSPAGLVLYNPQPVRRPTETEKLCAIRTELGIADDARVLGIFGRVERLKGPDVLINAVAHVVPRFPSLQLLVVGDSPNPEFQVQLKDLVTRHGLQGHVTFTGRRQDVLQIMELCNIVIMPSRAEALGRILLEAWAVRRPVIGSDVEGIREIITQAKGGLLFPSERAEELAKCIQQLLDDPSLSKRLAASGELWVKENCDPNCYAERLIEFLETLRRK